MTSLSWKPFQHSDGQWEPAPLAPYLTTVDNFTFLKVGRADDTHPR